MQTHPTGHSLTCAPLTAGAVAWVRGLLERIEEPMAKLKVMHNSGLDTELGAAIQRAYVETKAAMAEYERSMVEDWCKSVAATSDEKLNQPLLQVGYTTLLLQSANILPSCCMLCAVLLQSLADGVARCKVVAHESTHPCCACRLRRAATAVLPPWRSTLTRRWCACFARPSTSCCSRLRCPSQPPRSSSTQTPSGVCACGCAMHASMLPVHQ
jgi:hypothetical protein